MIEKLPEEAYKTYDNAQIALANKVDEMIDWINNHEHEPHSHEPEHEHEPTV
jgi:RAB protein geranylgeranyltransferase component A